MSTTGRIFRVTTYGESHGRSVGCIIDGCPPRIPLDESYIQTFLDRRRPGQSSLTTSRNEFDLCRIHSGVSSDGMTLGTPIMVQVLNKDQRTLDYAATDEAPRPGHADYTYQAKFGIRAVSGGGRASARETVSRVIGGAVAAAVLKQFMPKLKANAFVTQIGRVETPWHLIEKQIRTPMPCCTIKMDDGEMLSTGSFNEEISHKMAGVIKEAQTDGDSLGGVCAVVIKGVPVGLGEPVFEKLEALLAAGMMSIPATKGFEIGRGFGAASMRGSQHNDPFCGTRAGLRQTKNDAGGTLGGISSGEELYIRVAFKPVSSIGQEQQTASWTGEEHILAVKGRHDPCVLPRTPILLEATALMTILDLELLQRRNTII